MDAKKIVIIPTTHWDREWYVPFNEFRAYLVLMMDKLIEILKTDKNFSNFTLDGQVIALEDYLEVKSEKKDIIKEFIKEKRLSIGPFYNLPDEFLISGESLIRNLLLGHILGRKYGRVMKAGYIPDTFGHIAQLPQIFSGFEIPSALFMRGFGKEFEENNLNMEFLWNAPGNSASVIGIHLIQGYSSAARLNSISKNGRYNIAIGQLKRAIRKLEKYTGTNVVILNNGSDHLFPQPEVSEIVNQWNEENTDKKMEINDVEYYINEVLSTNSKLNSYKGELRGGKYHPLLSGVFSARMWIKQNNTKIEYLYEKYTEPISTITWILDKYNNYEYPNAYIWTGLKWLMKNHPHDSICGCSIDEVHEDMITRFKWAEEIGNEILTNSLIYLTKLININEEEKDKYSLIIFNPLPWERKDITYFDIIIPKEYDLNKFISQIRLTDYDNKEIEYQTYKIKEKPRYWQEGNTTIRISFIGSIPACGYKIHYVYLKSMPTKFIRDTNSFKIKKNSLENLYYKIEIDSNGQINLHNKKTNMYYQNILDIEDCGDWGDEYDYSGPKKNQTDVLYKIRDASFIEAESYIDGPSQKTLKVKILFQFPTSLKQDRSTREEKLVENKLSLYISLYKELDRIDFKIKYHNKSKDHRIRAVFNSRIKSEKVYADGHFYIVPRNIALPDSKSWVQKALATNHQKDFICIKDDNTCFAVFNKGLPEYEAIQNVEGKIDLGITLLRSIGWLSRGDFASRGNIAGPDLHTPGAQCLGKYIFELSLSIKHNKADILNSGIHVIGKEFNNPLISIIPETIKKVVRARDKLLFTTIALLQPYKKPKKNLKSYLQESLSFLKIENKNILLSALKKSEEGNFLILRIYNLASSIQKTNIIFFKELNIKDVQIVNFLEEKPERKINATIIHYQDNIVVLELNPHVIVSLKVDIQY